MLTTCTIQRMVNVVLPDREQSSQVYEYSTFLLNFFMNYQVFLSFLRMFVNFCELFCEHFSVNHSEGTCLH